MSRIKYLIIILFFPIMTLHAQYTRLSMEVYAGFPASITYFAPSFSTYGGLGLKYNLIKEFSLAGRFEIGTMSGKNLTANTLYVSPDNNNNYSNYSDNFYQYSLEGHINLERVFSMRRFLHRINPYLIAGGGLIHSNVNANRIDNYIRKYDVNFYTEYVGINIKYYMNPTLDISLGSTYMLSQSYFNDAVPIDKKLDQYILSYIGVSYKFGARKDRQHIEWNNVVLRDRIYIPDIEKHLGLPIDDAGNFFIFHKDSIAKLQAQNNELQKKSVQLEAKSVELEAKNNSQQKQIDSMQNQVKVIKLELDTIKNLKGAFIVDTARISSATDKKIVAKLQAENNELRIKDRKLELKVAEQHNQLEDMQNQLNQMKKQLDEKPEIKYVTPVETPADKHVVMPPDKSNEPVPVKKGIVKKSKIEKDNTNVLPSNTSTNELNDVDGVTAPIGTYNIIVGAYAGEKYAFIFRDKLRAKGYHAAVYQSNVNSKIRRVCVFTSEDKNEAMKMMRKMRGEIEPQAWIHIYHKK